MGVELLYEQFKEATNLKDFVQVFLNEFDVVKAEIDNLNNERNIDNATGVQITRNAKLIGLEIAGFSDDVLKEITKIQILVNTASGEPNRLMEIASKLGEHLSEVSEAGPINAVFVEDFPAAFDIELDITIDSQFRIFFNEKIKQATPVGVRHRVIHGGDANGNNRFTYDTALLGYDGGGKYTGVLS